MNELQKEIDNIFKLVSALTVSGNNVDIVFATKEALKKCFNMAASEKEKPSYESLEEK